MAKVKKSCWIIVEVDGKILLLKRSKKAKNSGMWNLPGGNLDEGETAPQAGAREMEEEAGIKIDPAKLKFITTMQIKDRHLAFYKIKMKKRPDVHINDESSKFDWFKPKKFPKPLHGPTAMFKKVNTTYL